MTQSVKSGAADADSSAELRKPVSSIVVMGVSGCGKSLIGQRVAQALGLLFLEGDAFHNADNVARMSRGVALTDADRAGWLQALAHRLRDARRDAAPVVLSCSALKRRYRDVLRQGDPDLRFVYLGGPRALIEKRMRARDDHFMPVALLDSQFRDLEPPTVDERALTMGIDAPPDRIVARVLEGLSVEARSHPVPQRISS